MNKIKSLLLNLQNFRLMLNDKKAGKWPKIVLVIAVIYLILPVDIISDFIPFLGLFDDAVVLITTLTAVGKSVKRYMSSEQ